MGRHGDDRNVARRLVFLDPLCQRQTIFAAQLHIEPHSVGCGSLEKPLALFQILSKGYFEALRFQPVREELAIGLVVLDYQIRRFRTSPKVLWGPPAVTARGESPARRAVFGATIGRGYGYSLAPPDRDPC
jgi:hypothetical protein